MDHEYCKQHSRPMPAPVMATIRVRREPKMDDLRESLRAYARLASVKKSRLIILGTNVAPACAEARALRPRGAA